MHTLPASPPDLPTLATLSAASYWHDPLYAFTHPHKTLHPSSFRYSFLRRLRTRFWTPGYVFRVAVTDPGDEGHEEGGVVVGYASWYRQTRGGGEGGKWWGWTVQGLIETTLQGVEDGYTTVFGLDGSVDAGNVQLWQRQTAEIFRDVPEMWVLKNLCVEPAFQRRGVGGMMVRWGMEQGVREGMPVGMSSSEIGAGLYERLGFRRWGTLRVEGFPVEDVPLFLWEPGVEDGAGGGKEGMQKAGKVVGV